MVVIEVRVNGELKATCGADDLRQLVARVSSTRASTPEAGEPSHSYLVECLGIRPNDISTDEVIKWVSARVQLGDDISFRLVEAATAQDPIDRQAIAVRDRSADT
jgi:hypothetical protein